METDRHSCKSHFLRQSQYQQVPCPICGQLITEYRGEYINEKVDKHIRAGCPNVSVKSQLRRANSDADSLLNNASISISQNEYLTSPPPENNYTYETGATIFSANSFSPKYDEIPVSVSSPTPSLGRLNKGEGSTTSGRVLFPQSLSANDKINNFNETKLLNNEPKFCTDQRDVVTSVRPEVVKPTAEVDAKPLIGSKRKKKKEKEKEPINLYATKLRVHLSFLSLNDPQYIKILIKCFVLSLFHSDMHRLPVAAALSYFQSGNPYIELPLFKSLENFLQKLCTDLLLNSSELSLLSLYMAQLNLLPAENYNSTDISTKFKDNLICSAYYVKMTYDNDHSIYMPYLVFLHNFSIVNKFR